MRWTPVQYQIADATVDMDLISMEIEAAISMRFLRAGDILILVLDNDVNHTGKENTVLEEHSVLVLFFPTRAQEWNPIELMWNCATELLWYFDLSNL